MLKNVWGLARGPGNLLHFICQSVVQCLPVTFSNLKQNLCYFSCLIWDPHQASLCESRNKKPNISFMLWPWVVWVFSHIYILILINRAYLKWPELQVIFLILWFRKDKKNKCRMLAYCDNIIISIRHVLVSPWRLKMAHFPLNCIWYPALAVNIAVQYTQISIFWFKLF